MKKVAKFGNQPYVKNCDYDVYECYECGFLANINYMDVNCATDEDPNPLVSCPKCGGCCEQWD